MDRGPLVKDEINAGADLVREFAKFAPVKAAFWLKPSDDEFRYLYIAYEGAAAHGEREGYEEVLRLLEKIGSEDLDPFRMKLIDADDPMAKAAIKHNERFPSPKGMRLGWTYFGGNSADDVYLYPAPMPAAVP